MIALLFLLATQQASSLEGEIRADFDRIPVGGEVIITVRARSASADPIQISLPPLAGLELIARSERSEVSAGLTTSRTTVLELRLRGSMPGKWRLGPAKIRQGKTTIETDPLEMEVTGSAGSATSTASSIGPAIQRLLARSRPPATGQDASVAIILSTTSAYIGEQVDVVTAAWFPRELRLQLRRPPTVQTPSIDGVYSYPQRSPTGIAASRQVDGRWFDLFVVHQIVFPLTPGRVRIPPATLHYSVPLAFQFFSQEERYAVHSDPVSLEVMQLPPTGRPAAFAGGVAHGLTVERTLTPRSGRAGEPFTVDIVVSGEGNVALWPPPTIEWPHHLRAYSEKISENIEINAGRLGGAKTFRYLVIPDSARTAGLATLEYAYFDPVTRSYGTATTPSVSYLVTPSREVTVSRASPAALKLDERPAAAVRLISSLPRWLIGAILLAPPLLVLLLRRKPIRKRHRPRPVERSRDPVAEAAAELGRILSRLVPRRDGLPADKFRSALRAAGIESTMAQKIVEVEEQLRAARYGPRRDQDRAGLLAEAHALVESLGPFGHPDRTRRSLTAALSLAAALGLASSLGAQTMPPNQLYESGALNAAASGFAQRARLEPEVAAHWFNLGATQFRMGAAGAALAAWTRAERLAPRDQAIRRALRLVPLPDTRSARSLWVPPVTPPELLVLAAVLWIVGWSAYAWTRRNRWLVVVLGSLVLVGGAQALVLWYRRPLGIVTAQQSLALSPHELAPAVTPVQIGSVVMVLQQAQGWAMVRDGGGQLGWLPLESVERL